MSDSKPLVGKTKITKANRHKELIQIKLKGEKIVAIGENLKRIYRVKN